MRKLGFRICKTKAQISFAVIFVFVTRIVQSIYSKFQAYSHLLWLCSPVCVGAGLKPQRTVFLTMRLIARYVSDLVRNPKVRFSHTEAHIGTVLLKMCKNTLVRAPAGVQFVVGLSKSQLPSA